MLNSLTTTVPCMQAAIAPGSPVLAHEPHAPDEGPVEELQQFIDELLPCAEEDLYIEDAAQADAVMPAVDVDMQQAAAAFMPAIDLGMLEATAAAIVPDLNLGMAMAAAAQGGIDVIMPQAAMEQPPIVVGQAIPAVQADMGDARGILREAAKQPEPERPRGAERKAKPWVPTSKDYELIERALAQRGVSAQQLLHAKLAGEAAGAVPVPPLPVPAPLAPVEGRVQKKRGRPSVAQVRKQLPCSFCAPALLLVIAGVPGCLVAPTLLVDGRLGVHACADRDDADAEQDQGLPGRDGQLS